MQFESTNTMLRRSIGLNNEGVEHMSRGDTSSALRCFSTALVAIQQHLVCVDRPEEGSVSSKYEPESVPSQHRPTPPSLILHKRTVVRTKADGDHHADGGVTIPVITSSRFLYPHALLIEGLDSFGDTDRSGKVRYDATPEADRGAHHQHHPHDDDITVVTCCACVLFNLALLHHARAIMVLDGELDEMKQHRYVNKIKAEQLYRLLITLIEDRAPMALESSCAVGQHHEAENEHTSSSSSTMLRQTWLVLVQMAALNNLGSLQELDEQPCAKDYARQTYSVLLSLMRDARTNNPFSFFFLAMVSNAEWKGMANNCFYMLMVQEELPTDYDSDDDQPHPGHGASAA